MIDRKYDFRTFNKRMHTYFLPFIMACFGAGNLALFITFIVLNNIPLFLIWSGIFVSVLGLVTSIFVWIHILRCSSNNKNVNRQSQRNGAKQFTQYVMLREQLLRERALWVSVIHEVNNPLASVAWSAESVEVRLQDVLNSGDDASHVAEFEEMIRYLSRLQDEAFRCKEYTSLYFDLYHPTGDEKTTTNLFEVIESVNSVVRIASRYRNRAIKLSGDRNLCVYANPKEIKQVALHLIKNSLDNLDEGECVNVDLRKEKQDAVIQVTDNGNGMSKEMLSQIFDPNHLWQDGNKLGLSFARKLVEDNGGKISGFSDGLGTGSSFRISLPLAKD